MNTIPLIFNEHQIKRTVIGGSETQGSQKTLPISVILLNRGASHFKTQNIEHLKQFHFQSIISVEQTVENYSIENLARVYPYVKFLIPLEKANVGEMINIAMGELESDYVLVLWDNARLSSHSLSSRFIEKIVAEDILCQVPLLKTHNSQKIPVEKIPMLVNNSFNISTASSESDKKATLFPFDHMGIYQRKKFIQLGGFDYTLEKAYWQKLDFFFRAWLWGEEVRLANLFTVQYLDDFEGEDATSDEYYLRFFLKNIAPVFKNDHAELANNKFFGYAKRAPEGWFDKRKAFKDAQSWIEKNKYRFKCDAKFLIEKWDSYSD